MRDIPKVLIHGIPGLPVIDIKHVYADPDTASDPQQRALHHVSPEDAESPGFGSGEHAEGDLYRGRTS